MSVRLSVQDDEILFITASALATIADRLEAGEEIQDLPMILRAAGAAMAKVMVDAYAREISFN